MSGDRVVLTRRLRLRPLEPADRDALHDLWTTPEVRRYLFDDEIVSRERVALEIEGSGTTFARSGWGLWAVLPREDPSPLIGFCGYREFYDPPQVQLLYGLDPRWWGRGLATEAARAMIRYGFEELGMERIVAATDAPHQASVRVMERCGLRFEKRTTIDGLNTLFYTLDRDAFRRDDQATG